MKICPHLAKPLDGLDVHFILLHLLPESNSLLRLCWVDVLGPATLAMVHASILCFIPNCVYLVCVCVHIHCWSGELLLCVLHTYSKGSTSFCIRGVLILYGGRGDTNPLTSCSDICGAYCIAMSTGFLSIKLSCRKSSGGMSTFSWAFWSENNGWRPNSDRFFV